MIDVFKDIKGVIFDYGGTIDTNSLHWSEVLWLGYVNANVEVSKEDFRTCYVHAERTLAKQPLIKPEHNFLDLLRIKVDIETMYLKDSNIWNVSEEDRLRDVETISQYCYRFVLDILKISRPVLHAVRNKYKTVLVSNFYGNINTILRDFALDGIFSDIIESSVVGIRKPDPQIFMLGVKSLNLKPEEIVVIGDSYKKDILPAKSIGCHTIWIKGKGWDEESCDEKASDVVINNIAKVHDLLL